MNESQKYIETLNKEYFELHIHEQEREFLISENKIEKRDVKGYHGREILELLQNADDAYQNKINEGLHPNSKLEVLIQYKNNVLTVSNIGTYFDREGIKAIVQGNNTSKGKGKYIGNKGTGFRSVLNWTDEIKIFSGKFNIKFSKEIAEREFDKMKNYPQIKKQLVKSSNLYVPILAVPKNIQEISSDFDTTIQMKIDPLKTSDGFGVLDQILNIDLRLLLFLPNINSIIIELSEDNVNEIILYEREVFNNKYKEISLKKYVNGTQDATERYYIFEKEIHKAITEDDEEKDIRMAIAIPTSYDNFESSTLYSFFPLLDTESPFNCVMHASYILGDQRDNIINSTINKTIIKEQLKFLKEVALEFACENYGDLSLRLLTPKNYSIRNWRFASAFSKFDLEDYYLDLIKDAKVLETVNSNYISILDNPRILENEFPKVFVGNKFNKLLKMSRTELNNIDLLNLVETIAKNTEIKLEYNEFELFDIVNNQSDKWNINEHIEVFSWWNNNFYKTIPKLLKTEKGRWLSYKEACYFLIGNINKGIPSWVKVPSLDKEYQNRLFEDASYHPKIVEIREKDKDTHISRLISQNEIYPLVDFTYRDRNNIITTVNSSVDTYNKAIDFVKWLWGNYRYEGNEWTPPRGSENNLIKYNFPNAINNTISNGDRLYFGSEYGNELASKLFDESYGIFPQQNIFNINSEDELLFIDFIKGFGVNMLPKIEIMDVWPDDNYNKIYKEKILSSGETGASNDVYIQYELPFISRLDDILVDLTTVEVIYWFKNDYLLRAFLSNIYYAENAKIKFRGTYQQYLRNYRGQIYNYILFVFNNTKWVEIDGSRYTPKEVLWGINNRVNSKFSEVVPVLNVEYVENIAKNLKINYREIIEIMSLFHFCEKVTDLSSEDFYGLMLKLPEINFSTSVALSKSIYRIIEQSGYFKDYEESNNKAKFIKEGKLLVKYQGKVQYYLASKCFLPSTKIVSKINMPIVEKGQRTSNINFVKSFGCMEYDKEYSISNESIQISKVNNTFKEYFAEFSKFARAYSERNDNIARISGKLNVILVDKISIIENENVIEVREEYVPLRETSTKWYITTFDHDYDIVLLSEQIENIYSNIANTPGFDAGKIGELFRTSDRTTREFLIKKEFDSLDVIADEFYNNQVRNNFIDTIYKINPDYNVKDIDLDFDDFSNVNNGIKIIKILTDLETDIDEFIENGFVYTIDLIPYYKKELERFLREEAENYINSIYYKAINNIDLQKMFLNQRNKFLNYKLGEFEDSIYFCVIDKVISEFGDWRILEKLDASNAYKENFDKLNPNNLFRDEISTNARVQIMIYFNKKDEFYKWVESQNEERKGNATVDDYKDLKDIIPIEKPIEYQKPKIKTNFKNGPRNNGVFTATKDQMTRKAKKILGNKGELIVYNKLCAEYGKNNVFPKSESFVEMGILKAGQASSGQYDLSYKNFQGKEYFVEVKTGDGQSFIITPGELEFAKEYSEHFKLYLVSEVDSTTPILKVLPPRFWEDDNFRLNSVVERIEVEF